MSKKKQREQIPHPPIRTEYSEDFKTIHINGVYGGHRPGYMEAVFYTDELGTEEALETIPPNNNKIYIKRTLQIRFVMDMPQAKSLLKWLNDHVAKWEDKFGPVPEPGEGLEPFK